ncbi:hypothetical protein [Salmonella enterica]|uniref:hypothetical protein n=1 Tax=Salmonella enterica TaxID=28901 RepID=UPI003D16D947
MDSPHKKHGITYQLIGVDQGIDHRYWQNNSLERGYVERSQGHEVFVLNADTAEIIVRMATDEYKSADTTNSPYTNNLAFDTEKKYLFLTVKNDETLIRDK